MISLELPRFCSIPNTLEALASAGVLDGDWDELEFVIPEKAFVLCSTMSFLCAWGLP